MADAFTNITTFINSPPGQLIAGATLAGIVWKFFERVEAVLTDQTKLEIAVWLVGQKPIGPKMEPWPDTFARVFDRVFGSNHLSLRCFSRSAVASFIVAALAWLFTLSMTPVWGHIWRREPLVASEGPVSVSIPYLTILICGIILAANILPDYLSLLFTRYSMRLMKPASSILAMSAILVGDLLATAAIPGVPMYIFEKRISNDMYGSIEQIARQPEGKFAYSESVVFKTLSSFPEVGANLLSAMRDQRSGKAATAKWEVHRALWFLGFQTIISVGLFPAFFTSIWLWLYAGSGFLLKFARRFDLGFQWFNKRFDIEKKPLQSIGLVSGAIVAVIYWSVAIVARVV